MPDEPFGLSTIGQILVPVTDLARATAFYRDQLGMRFLFEYPGMAFFDAGGVRLYLVQPEAPDFRGVATRYDKLAANYLAFVKLACIRLWLRVYEFTA